MKKILLSLFVISGCSSVDVYPVREFVDLSKADLIHESKINFKESSMEDYSPSKQERNKYFSNLENSITYKNYLILECALLFQKEYNLQLSKPVYVSVPKWNNVQNWFTTIFNFQSLVNNVTDEKTMECDLAVNDKKEVSEYQLKESYEKIIKK